MFRAHSLPASTPASHSASTAARPASAPGGASGRPASPTLSSPASTTSPTSPASPGVSPRSPATLPPAIEQAVRAIRTPRSWNSVFGDVAPQLIVKLPGWPAGRALHIITGSADAQLDHRYAAISQDERHGTEAREKLNFDEDVVIVRHRDHYDAFVDGRIARIRGDGNCFYAAVLAALGQRDARALTSGTGEVQALREALALHIEQEADTLAPFFAETDALAWDELPPTSPPTSPPGSRPSSPPAIGRACLRSAYSHLTQAATHSGRSGSVSRSGPASASPPAAPSRRSFFLPTFPASPAVSAPAATQPVSARILLRPRRTRHPTGTDAAAAPAGWPGTIEASTKPAAPRRPLQRIASIVERQGPSPARQAERMADTTPGSDIVDERVASMPNGLLRLALSHPYVNAARSTGWLKLSDLLSLVGKASIPPSRFRLALGCPQSNWAPRHDGALRLAGAGQLAQAMLRSLLSSIPAPARRRPGGATGMTWQVPSRARASDPGRPAGMARVLGARHAPNRATHQLQDEKIRLLLDCVELVNHLVRLAQTNRLAITAFRDVTDAAGQPALPPLTRLVRDDAVSAHRLAIALSHPGARAFLAAGGEAAAIVHTLLSQVAISDAKLDILLGYPALLTALTPLSAYARAAPSDTDRVLSIDDLLPLFGVGGPDRARLRQVLAGASACVPFLVGGKATRTLLTALIQDETLPAGRLAALLDAPAATDLLKKHIDLPVSRLKLLVSNDLGPTLAVLPELAQDLSVMLVDPQISHDDLDVMLAALRSEFAVYLGLSDHDDFRLEPF